MKDSTESANNCRIAQFSIEADIIMEYFRNCDVIKFVDIVDILT